MSITVGIFPEHDDSIDVLWEQCDGPHGEHQDIRLVGLDNTADHILVINNPWRPGARPRLALADRLRQGLGGDSGRRKLELAWEALQVPRERTVFLGHEPPTNMKDRYYEVAEQYAARVYGPDPRAQHRMRLRSVWLVNGDRQHYLQMQPREKTVPLALVTSGKTIVPGHPERLRFLSELRRAGVEFELFGRGLDAALRSRGSVRSKAAVLRPARYALAMENYAEGNLYVTDKMWDALLNWCLPFFWGMTAVDEMIPPEAYIRLPDLGADGVECVREALAHPEWWDLRLDAMAEARRRILGDLRLVEWIRRTVVHGEGPRWAGEGPRDG